MKKSICAIILVVVLALTGCAGGYVGVDTYPSDATVTVNNVGYYNTTPYYGGVYYHDYERNPSYYRYNGNWNHNNYHGNQSHKH